MWIRQKRAALGGLAMAATAFGVAIPSLAAADTAPASPDPAVVVVGSDAHAEDGGELSCEVLFGGEFVDGEFVDGDWEEWVPSAEELAEINAETDDLVAFLAENGVSVEVETDDLGFRFPAFDENTDEAVFDLVDEFFAERYGDEGWLIDEADLADLEDGEFVDGEFVDGDWEEWVPSAEELAEINAETDDLVAFLAENGVSVEVETDDLGFRFPAFDENTDEAVFDLVDEFFAERYGDEGWLIDEADLADLEDGECYFEDDHDHETDHETGYGVEYGGVELDLSDEELAELAEDFDLEVEELVELIDLLIG